MKQIQAHVLIILFSGGLGAALGWHFRVPNQKLFEIIVRATSMWQKDLAIEFWKNKEPYFSDNYFEFNSTLGVVVFLSSMIVLSFFFSSPFRTFIFKKFSFEDEKLTP